MNLERARNHAKKEWGYRSTDTREQIRNTFQACCPGKEPHDWQLDVAEAILLGLDCTVIAGTGAGKTMPFIMPLFAEGRKKVVVIISPLNVLEEDQVYTYVSADNKISMNFL